MNTGNKYAILYMGVSVCKQFPSPNYKCVLCLKHILGYLKICWCWAFPNSAGGVVVRAVAGAKVASEVALVGDGNAAQVSAHANQDQPLWLLYPVVIVLGVPQSGQIGVFDQIDFILRAVPNKQGLPLPIEDGVLSLGDGREVYFNLCHGQDISRSAHGGEKVYCNVLGGVNGSNASSGEDQIGGSPPAHVASWAAAVVGALSSVLCEIGDREVCVAAASWYSGCICERE